MSIELEQFDAFVKLFNTTAVLAKQLFLYLIQSETLLFWCFLLWLLALVNTDEQCLVSFNRILLLLGLSALLVHLLMASIIVGFVFSRPFHE